MNNIKIVFIFYILILFFSCRGNKNKFPFTNENEKFFYTDCCGFDYIRFPLIYPYEVMNAEVGSDKWIINLNFHMDYNSIFMVKKICVIDSVILVNSTYPIPVEKGEKPLHWFVIIPSDSLEIGFNSEVELDNYIKQYNITKYKWKNVEDTYKEFKDTECLPWIFGCDNR